MPRVKKTFKFAGPAAPKLNWPGLGAFRSGRIAGVLALFVLAAGLAQSQTCAQLACPLVGTLSNSTSTLTFSVPPNTGTSTQTITLSFQYALNDPPIYQVTVANPNANFAWLSVTPASGLFSLVNFDGTNFNFTATVTVTVDPSGFSAGSSNGAVITVSAAQQSVSTSVVLNVLDPAQLASAPASLSFSYSQGGAVPAPQNLSVTSNPPGESYAVFSSGSAGGKWLSVPANLKGTTPGIIPVSVNPAGLAVGSYSGQISINPTVGPSLQVPVSLTVTALIPPVLSVIPPGQTFALPQNGAPVNAELVVADNGGGTLQFSGSADCSWVRVGPPGSAAAGLPGALAFTVDPTGLSPQLYTCHITVKDTANAADPSQQVTVTLAVSAAPQAITLSRTGLVFNAVASAPQPNSQSLTISGGGASQLSWSTQTQLLGVPVGQPSWLSVSPSSGAAPGGSGATLTVSANPTGLTPGQYYGTVNIVAPNAANSPQTVSVVLNVAAVGGPPSAGVQVPVAGLVMKGTAGSAVPAQQQIVVFSPGSSPVNFTMTPSAPWLSVTPSTGSLNPGTNLFTVFAAPSGLTAGIQRANLNMSFGDGSTGQAQVALLALPLTSSASSPVCPAGKPSSLIAAFRQPASQASLSAAVAQPVQIQLVDDCGNPVTAKSGGSVLITFNDGDPAVNLSDAGGGIWEGNWTPVNPAASAVVQVVARQAASGASSGLFGSASVGVSVQPVSIASAPQASGVVNAASAAKAVNGISSPGSYVAIYGSGLAASGNAATSIPLPTTLNGTQALLGGQALPLSYAGPGQINAVVPQGLSVNAAYPLVIVRGAAESVPVPVLLTAYQPAIYTADQSGSGQGIAEIANTTLLAGPLANGYRPVKSGSEFLTVFATGLGPVAGPNGEAAPADGAAAPLSPVYKTTATVTATIGGVNAPVVFAGLTPTLVALYQVNVQVPAGVQTGNAVPLVLTVTDPATGTAWQSNTVTVAIQ